MKFSIKEVVTREAWKELKSFRQGTFGVQEYYIKLMSLLDRANRSQEDWMIEYHFMTGLNNAIKNRLWDANFLNPSHMYLLALQAEQDIQDDEKRRKEVEATHKTNMEVHAIVDRLFTSLNHLKEHVKVQQESQEWGASFEKEVQDLVMEDNFSNDVFNFVMSYPQENTINDDVPPPTIDGPFLENQVKVVSLVEDSLSIEVSEISKISPLLQVEKKNQEIRSRLAKGKDSVGKNGREIGKSTSGDDEKQTESGMGREERVSERIDKSLREKPQLSEKEGSLSFQPGILGMALTNSPQRFISIFSNKVLNHSISMEKLSSFQIVLQKNEGDYREKKQLGLRPVIENPSNLLPQSRKEMMERQVDPLLVKGKFPKFPMYCKIRIFSLKYFGKKMILCAFKVENYCEFRIMIFVQFPKLHNAYFQPRIKNTNKIFPKQFILKDYMWKGFIEKIIAIYIRDISNYSNGFLLISADHNFYVILTFPMSYLLDLSENECIRSSMRRQEDMVQKSKGFIASLLDSRSNPFRLGGNDVSRRQYPNKSINQDDFKNLNLMLFIFFRVCNDSFD